MLFKTTTNSNLLLIQFICLNSLKYLFEKVLIHNCCYLALTTKRNSLRYPCSICSAHSSCGTEQFKPSITCVSGNCSRFYCRCTKLNRWMSRSSGKPTFQCWKIENYENIEFSSFLQTVSINTFIIIILLLNLWN